ERLADDLGDDRERHHQHHRRAQQQGQPGPDPDQGAAALVPAVGEGGEALGQLVHVDDQQAEQGQHQQGGQQHGQDAEQPHPGRAQEQPDAPQHVRPAGQRPRAPPRWRPGHYCLFFLRRLPDPNSASRTRAAPMASIQESLASPTPCWLGAMEPSRRVPSDLRYSRVREPPKTPRPSPARLEGTKPMPSSAMPRAISLVESSCTKSLGSMSANWGRAWEAWPCSHLTVSSSAPSFNSPWSRMMAPVASRTGTCHSLVAILLLLEGRRLGCASTLLPCAAAGGECLVLARGRLLPFAERAFYPARAPLSWWEPVPGDRGWEERR